MGTYTVEATKRIFLTTTIEAESLEEAERIADQELITDDFEEKNTDFRITEVG